MVAARSASSSAAAEEPTSSLNFPIAFFVLVFDYCHCTNRRKDQGPRTGGWGCGAFGGDWWLKFLQQAIAGSLAGKRLQFSTFKKPALAAELSGLLSPGATVGDVWKILVSFDGSDAPSFHNHVRKSLAATK